MMKTTSKKWQKMSFLELAATYDFTRSEANTLTILAKSQKFAKDNNVIKLLKVLGTNALGVGRAILRVDNSNKKDKRMAELWLRTQGFDKNGKRIKNK